MPHEWPFPPTSKICFTLTSASSKPWNLNMARTMPSFSDENLLCLPISVSSTMRNVLSAGSANPAFAATCAAGRAMVSAVRTPSASQYALWSSAFSAPATT